MAKNIKQHSLLYIRLKEAYLIATLCMALGVIVALASYSPMDNSWLVATFQENPINFLGNIGAQLASFLLWLFGWSAYLLPFCIASLAIFTYREKIFGNKQQIFLLLKSLGLISLLCAIAGILNLLDCVDNYKLPSTNGGVVGAILATSLSTKLNIIGTMITLVSVSLVGLTIAYGLVWLQVFKSALKLCGKIFIKSLILLVKYMRWVYKISKNSRQAMLQPIWQAHNLEEPVEPKEDVSLDKDPSTLKDIKPLKKKKLKITNDILPEVKKSLLTAGYLPPVDLLYSANNDPKIEHYSDKVLQNLSSDLENKLKDFGVEAKVSAVYPGPVITRFELELSPGIKASKVSGLAKDLARRLSVPSVRVVEIIPGKTAIGLEIPNKNREVVRMREIVEAPIYQNSPEALTLALGKDIAGKPFIANLARMPHLLIAGSTGSGKSVAINVMLLSLLYKTTPADVRLLLIDPKMLELAVYDGIAHLITSVVTDMTQATTALRWCVNEMERRYKLMADLGVRNITGYNEKIAKTEDGEKLPFIVIMIDEFADLIISIGKDVEDLITRITQKARASGIHMILATQRPSVDVITGLIKANIPTRIAFQVASRIDSRTILDQQGAEQLLGHGDLLYLAPGSGIPLRVHGALVEDDEVHAVVENIKNNYGEPEYLVELANEVNLDLQDSSDELYETAVQIVLESKKTSISYLQRRLKIGYNRAARLIESMESTGILSQIRSNGLREIL